MWRYHIHGYRPRHEHIQIRARKYVHKLFVFAKRYFHTQQRMIHVNLHMNLNDYYEKERKKDEVDFIRGENLFQFDP